MTAWWIDYKKFRLNWPIRAYIVLFQITTEIFHDRWDLLFRKYSTEICQYYCHISQLWFVIFLLIILEFVSFFEETMKPESNSKVSKLKSIVETVCNCLLLYSYFFIIFNAIIPVVCLFESPASKVCYI